MRRVHTFVPIESEIERVILELAAGSSKRDAEEELDQKSSKRQKTGESSELAEEPRDKEADELSQEEIQQMMIIVPEQGMNVEALLTKYLIIDWEIYTEGTRIIRVRNHTERFNLTEPTDDKEREIWVELKRLFEPDTDNELWKLQKHIHDLTWKLYDSCGMHHVSTKKGIDIYMLVEKEYPLLRGTLTQMLVAKLLVEQDNEMSRELLRKIFMYSIEVETPAMLAIREGKIQKDKKKLQREKGKDKGKNKLAYAPNPKIPPSPKRDNPKKDSVCHHCKKGLKGSMKLKHGALSLYTGNGMRAAIEAIGSFDLVLPSGLIIVLDNYNVFYFNTIPCDGIYEIDMHNLYPNVSFMFNVSNKRAKHALESSYLCHCHLGHINKKHMDKLQRDGILQLTHDESLEKCEYLSYEFVNHMKSYGIVSQLTQPYTPQHNGVSERRNQTLLDMVRSMMNLTTLPKSFWGYALESVVRILNIVPTKKVEMTPYEIWHGKAPKLPYLREELIRASRLKKVMADKGKKSSMETFAPNDKADYYSRITSITVNRKNAYELKGKFFDDLHNNAFSGTNEKDEVEHIEYYLKIIDPIKLPNVDHDKLRVVVFPISLARGARRWFDRTK
ncbi:retrotransposon protein, putative, ty1-copia subclass [Tanacetum coccineum]